MKTLQIVYTFKHLIIETKFLLSRRSLGKISRNFFYREVNNRDNTEANCDLRA